MYNSSKAVIFVGGFVSLVFLLSVIRFLSVTLLPDNSNNVPTYLVSYKNRIWWTSKSGKLLYVAVPTDVLKKAIISGIEVKELSVSEKSLEVMTKLSDIVENPYITELRLNQKCAILLKGVILYFGDWEDLLHNIAQLEDLAVVMQPKAEYFLTSAGLVYKIRGGGGEEE
ncbi:MAG TPA: DUF4894 domain-containing protein [Pseudothermotoga sp.]|nr:DUF4894 domain-containing protein [Pseudothermotoga sp.]HOK82893.1 DUF4894 domain-containing protein [Pseudothermotoga sp.]HPP69934.1 DUF4894 domain-containing protein [Pseudothermotoga sp.]